LIFGGAECAVGDDEVIGEMMATVYLAEGEVDYFFVSTMWLEEGGDCY
jgi:hypothetical protein